MNKSIQVSELGERPLIKNLCKIFAASQSPEIMMGAGSDDCAVIDISEDDCLVVTTDMLHRTTDFPPRMSPWQIGWMSMAVNLSDVASMGARPVGVLAAIGFSSDTDVGFVEEIAKGMSDCAKASGTQVIGGDIDTHDELTITGTAIGRVAKDQLLTRKGAKIGDLVCVTGYAGSAGAALEALEKGVDVSDELLNCLLEPVPRTFEAQKLAASGAVTSMMDTSDGLAMSIHDLANASDIGFRIYEDRLPVMDEVRSFAGDEDELMDLALYTGGDFELLFTVRPDMLEEAHNVCYLNVIGEIVGNEQGVTIERGDGSNLSINRKGYLQLERMD